MVDRNKHLRKYSTVQRWTRNLKENTAQVHLDAFRLWMEWLQENGGEFKDMDPDQLVAYQREHKGYNLLDVVQIYITEIKARNLRKNTVKGYYSAVKSFFRHNRAAFPEDVFRPKATRPPVRGTLTRNEIKEVILASNPTYRAVFACMYAGIMGWGELEYWSNHGYSSLMEQLERGETIIVAWQSGRKLYLNEMPVYNLIGGDALQYLTIYLDKYRPEGPGAIFRNKNGDPLQYRSTRTYWTERLKQLGFVEEINEPSHTTRYGKNLHEIRDVARTWWKRGPADLNLAEFMMGHSESLDPNNYEKIYRDQTYARREYRKNLPYVNLVSEDPTQMPVEKYEADMDRLRAVEQDIKDINTLIKSKKYGPKFRKLLKEAIEDQEP